MARAELIDIAMCQHAETEKAVLVSDTADRADAVWLPKSQIEIRNDGYKNFVTITMPNSLAIEKGLV